MCVDLHDKKMVNIMLSSDCLLSECVFIPTWQNYGKYNVVFWLLLSKCVFIPTLQNMVNIMLFLSKCLLAEVTKLIFVFKMCIGLHDETMVNIMLYDYCYQNVHDVYRPTWQKDGKFYFVWLFLSSSQNLQY